MNFIVCTNNGQFVSDIEDVGQYLIAEVLENAKIFQAEDDADFHAKEVGGYSMPVLVRDGRIVKIIC